MPSPKTKIQNPRSVVIPVIDLKDGVVVRGVAGRRDEYRPIESRFASDPRPATVAQGLARTILFPDRHGSLGGRHYTTAMCVMMLEVYYRHMPLYGETAVEFDL